MESLHGGGLLFLNELSRSISYREKHEAISFGNNFDHYTWGHRVPASKPHAACEEVWRVSDI